MTTTTQIPPTDAVDIRRKAQLVIVSVSSWGGEKVDRGVSIATCQNQQADRKSGRFVKKLVPPEALKARGKAVTALRETVERLSLPFDRGRRLLPNASYIKNLKQIKDSIKAVEDATEDFLYQFPSWQQAGQANLGKMYDPADYPSISQLRTKFDVALDFEPIPRKEHFLLDMNQGIVDEIAAKAEAKVESRLQEAQQSAWTNVLEVTSHFAEVMSDPSKRFKRSTFDKLLDTLEVTPALNLQDDPMLDAVVEDIRDTLSGIDVDMLRNNPKVRATVAKATSDHSEEISKLCDFADAIS